MNQPPLKFLHVESSLIELKLEYFRRISTEDLIESLNPEPSRRIENESRRNDNGRTSSYNDFARTRRWCWKIAAWDLEKNKMIAEVFWTKEKYPGRIALVPRPRGGEWLENETAAWSDVGIDVIVSMLEAEETRAFELEREAEFCAENGIEFVACPVTDRSIPKMNEAFLRTIRQLKNLLLKGKNIGIHCRQSVGRAPLMAAVLMISFGINPTEAFRQLSIVRGVEVPETDEQRKWAERFAEETATVLS